MDPNYLHALMHGELHKENNKENKEEPDLISDEMDKEIDSYVDSLSFEEDPQENQLMDPKLKKEKMKVELKEAVRLPETLAEIDRALELLFSEGASYFSDEVNKQLITDLLNAVEPLSNFKFDESKNLQMIANISDESMAAIMEIALAKFNEERFSDALSLFSFLSFLNPGYSEYWFRLGVSAQKNENIDTALRAYQATLALDKKHLGARLFAAECLVQLKRLDEAKAEIAFAKEIAKESKTDKMWDELIETLETMLGGKG